MPEVQAKYPQIETERLLLRMFRAEDLDAVYQLFNNADIQKYLSAENKRTRERLKTTLKVFVRRWAERGVGIWCVTDKKNGEIVGYCGFQYFEGQTEIEILFAFLKNVWGGGLATEAAKACLSFWFEELSFDKVIAVTSPQNISSQCVLSKIGMLYIEQSAHYKMETSTYLISRDQYQTNDSFYKLTWHG